MSAFTSCAPPRAAAPDACKRVNYTHGLVLGVDEYLQEFAYLSGRDEWLARDLVGYGTIAGLRVEAVQVPQRGPAILVGSGLALSVKGRPIRVPLAEVVHLNEWLEAQRGAFVPHLRPGGESPPGDVLPLYVVLAYRECATDGVPGPGQPCRTDEPPSVYTRIADGHRLEIRFTRPDQQEEDALRGFVAWLRQVELVDSEASALSLDEFVRAVRAAAAPASPPDVGLASPPEPVRIPAALACQFLRAAFQVWATDIRPLWRPGASGPASCASDDAEGDEGVLLAEIEVPLISLPDGRSVVDETSRIAINEERRPVVVHLRLLQEWALCRDPAIGSAGTIAAAGIVRGDITNTTHRRPLLNGLRVTGVADGEVTIAFDGYIPPPAQGPFQFIVKALSQTRGAAPGAPIVVNLGGFEPNGIRLRLTDAQGSAIPASDLADLEISIEVSRYAS